MQQIKKIDFHIPELNSMKKYPQNLYYIGNLNLLKRKKIGVVGSRKPEKYSREMTYRIVNELAQGGNTIVSGGAIGIDTVAHKASGIRNTIMIAGTGLDIQYPTINKKMIQEIEQKGLLLSQFSSKTPSLPRNFVLRNELIVALSDILIVSYADIKSGTMRSIEYALKMGKDIYVLPHRIGESEGTNKLLKEHKAQAIYDVNEFVSKFINRNTKQPIRDEFLEYCKTNPTYEEALSKFSEKVFEYELLGKIKIHLGHIFILNT